MTLTIDLVKLLILMISMEVLIFLTVKIMTMLLKQSKMQLDKKLNGNNSLQGSLDKKSIQMFSKLDFQL